MIKVPLLQAQIHSGSKFSLIYNGSNINDASNYGLRITGDISFKNTQIRLLVCETNNLLKLMINKKNLRNKIGFSITPSTQFP